MFGLGHHDKDVAPPVGPAPAPEADPVAPAAKAAKPMIEGVPSEIGGDEVRKSVEDTQAQREADMAARDQNEVSVGASTVKSAMPPTPPAQPPELPPAA